MGVFQSVGGAATSGKSLHDRHVRAAILAALEHGGGGSPMSNGTGDHNVTDSARRRAEYHKKVELDGQQSSAVLPDSEYTLEQNTECTVQVFSPSSEPTAETAGKEQVLENLQVTEYAPEVFRALRHLGGTTDNNFVREWTKAPPNANTAADAAVASGTTPATLTHDDSQLMRQPTAVPETDEGMQLGEGRSGALFLKSKSMAFMCKTISETEVQVLMGLLKNYLLYLESNPDSMLMRFVMMLRVTLNQDVGYLLIFSDCFSSCDVLHERWDLKGRHPKPGKFRHFPNHHLRQNIPTSQDNDDVSSTDSEYEKEKAKNQPQNIRTADSRRALKLMTYKDKNLSRLFWLESEDREHILKQITADFEFLLSCGLMDYSILIGVRYNTPEEAIQKEILRDQGYTQQGRKPRGVSPANFNSSTTNRSNKPNSAGLDHTTNTSMRMVFAMGEEGNIGAFEQRASIQSPESAIDDENDQLSSTQLFLTSINSKLSKFHRGVNNIQCVETYYIGIIDMLTVYNGKKKTANFCKKFLWRANTLSTIPPKQYAKRIEKYAHQIFPKVDVTDDAFGSLSPKTSPTVVRVRRGTNAGEPAKKTTFAVNDDEKPLPISQQPHHQSTMSGDEEAFLNQTVVSEDMYEEKQTQLHEAVASGKAADVQKLINAQENVNAPNEDGKTPLHIAAEKGQTAAAKALISAKVDVNYSDRFGRTPLHYAALSGSKGITVALIAAGADVNHEDKALMTPLHNAAANSFTEVVRALLAAKAQVNLKDEEGMTPLMCAKENEDDEIIEMLKEAGAVDE